MKTGITKKKREKREKHNNKNTLKKISNDQSRINVIRYLSYSFQLFYYKECVVIYRVKQFLLLYTYCEKHIDIVI